MTELWGKLRAAFDDFSGRERILLVAVAVLSVGMLLYFGIVQTSLSLQGDAEERLDSAEQQLQAMSRLRREYDDVAERLSSVEQRIAKGQRGNLRTTLETLARTSLVKIESMEPQATPSNDRYRETKVEVGLKEVTLAQTVNYLQQIETADQTLSIKSLRMRTRKDKPEFLDVTFTVSAFEPL